MAINASHIVSIMPRTLTGGSDNLELNGLVLVKNEIISADTLVVSFASASAVGDYFGVDSLEYETASTYFTSYDNKFAAPSALNFALRVDEDKAAWIRSAQNEHTLAEFKAIDDGVITITVNGEMQEKDGIDFTNVTSLSEVASFLNDYVTDVEITYSSLTKAFTIKTLSTGDEATISFASPRDSLTPTEVDLGVYMGFTETAGAVLSQGMNALTETEQMEAICKKTLNWVSYTTAWEPEEDEAIAYAKWASNNFGWLYVPFSYDARCVSQDSDTDLGSVLKSGGYDHVAMIYGSLAYAAFLMGCVASIPWERTNGTITLAFKSQSGLAPLVTDLTDATVLEGKNINYYGVNASRKAEWNFLYNGCLTSSDYRWIDAYVNAIWFTCRLQVAIMDGLKAAPRVPYTDRGYTMIRAWMMDPIQEALHNAVIEAGVTLSEAQKSEIYNEVGWDISDELWTQGYHILINDPGASVRQERGTPEIAIHYTYGGAVHKIECACTAVL